MGDVIRDKSYVEVDGMLFNVTGYEHPANAYFASLKYVNNVKWKAGYLAACDWLRSNHPDLIGKFIQVPFDRICTVYDPGSRWRELRMQSPGTLSRLHQEALCLGEELSARLEIPIADFGVTDSLLWGEGHSESDIDLVVYGSKYTNQILSRAEAIYHGEFQRPDPLVMTAPYSLQVKDWPMILAKKLHMGAFRGRLFSLRVILEETELAAIAQARSEIESDELQQLEFRVADVSQSLCFPAVYRDDVGNELVDYSVVYEGVFRVGEVVRATASIEGYWDALDVRLTRYVLGAVQQVC